MRFDSRTGRGRGVELDQPPYGMATEELFRVDAGPTETIATIRIVSTNRALGANGKERVAVGGP